MEQARWPVWNHVELLWNHCGIVVASCVAFYSLIDRQISSARLTMRQDEVPVYHEADDHHISCSCSCSRHRSTKAPSCLRRRVSSSRHSTVRGTDLVLLSRAEEPPAAVRCANEILALVHSQQAPTKALWQ
jgi:hypothetical protein